MGAIVVDEAALLENFGGDREILSEVVQIFLRDHGQLLEDVRVAIRAADAQQLRNTAHTLKGAVSNFSPEVGQLVFELEALGRRGTTAGALEHFPSVESAVLELGNAVGAFVLA